jgi:hypothetical protein
MRRTDVRHVHGLGYLARGYQPRCGCDPDVLPAIPWPNAAGSAKDDAWVPVQHQQTGYVRAHFIYSDRMRCAF